MIFNCKCKHFKNSAVIIALIFFFAQLPHVKSGPISGNEIISRTKENKNLTQNWRYKKDIWGELCLRSPKPHNAENTPKFILFTRKNKSVSQKLFGNNSWILNDNFNGKLPTKIIIHGWRSDIRLTPLVDIKNEYLKRSEYNIIFVDWEKLASDDCYFHAVWHSKYVGQLVAEMIQRLRDISHAQNIHIIGFSLGAHVAGFAANHLKAYKLSRITGLDPAMLGFITVSSDNRLDADDAQFVDVYHTNAMTQGKLEECGHVDFYMNGGVRQPGCDESSNCDHTRAPYYFAESINSDIGFWGWPCQGFLQYVLDRCTPTKDARILAGDKVNPNSKGYYIVKVNTHSPFATDDI